MNWGQIGVRGSDGEGDLGAVLWNVTEKKETPASLSGVARVFMIHLSVNGDGYTGFVNNTLSLANELEYPPLNLTKRRGLPRSTA